MSVEKCSDTGMPPIHFPTARYPIRPFRQSNSSFMKVVVLYSLLHSLPVGVFFREWTLNLRDCRDATGITIGDA